MHLATAHDMAELGLAARLGADAVLLSPVFPTRTHPGGAVLGPVRFRLLAQQSRLQVIALGGMTAEHARTPRLAALGGNRWPQLGKTPRRTSLDRSPSRIHDVFRSGEPAMASRAVPPRKTAARKSDAEWRAGLRRGVRRLAQITGAALLLGATMFLGLALASYTQTDPSPSTAADPRARSPTGWGAAGAWVADRGAAGVWPVRCPACCRCSTSRRASYGAMSRTGTRPKTTPWWLPAGLLLMAMALLSTVLALALPGRAARCPRNRAGWRACWVPARFRRSRRVSRARRKAG